MANLNPEILITAKDEASKVLKQVGDQAEKTGKSFKDIAKDSVVPLTTAFAGASAVVFSSIKAFSDSQNAIAQLNAVLKSTKGIAGVTADEVLKLSSALQQQSKFDDEAITGAQNILLTFTSIGKNVFPTATQAILDVSQAMGQDLVTTTKQLGIALNNPIEGMARLTRIGVQFTPAQKELIKTMQESGDIMGAQNVILSELATEFGGSALASSKTFDGQITILKNNLNDLQETIGGGLLQSLTALTGGLDGANGGLVGFNKFLQENKVALDLISGALIALVAGLGILLVVALGAMAGLSAGFVALGALIIAVLGGAINVIIQRWGSLKGYVDGVINFMNSKWGAFVMAIVATFTGGIGTIRNMFYTLRNALSQVLTFRIAVDIPNITQYIRDRFNDARKALPSNLKGLIPQFATGGIVGGAIGQPQLAMVHGGEEIVPYRGGQKSSGGGSITLNVSIGMYAGTEVEKRRIAEELHRALKVSAGAQSKTVAEMYT